MQKHYDHIPLEVVRSTFATLEVAALDVYKETDLTPSWQQAFRNGRLKDPSYSRICMLVGWLARNHPDTLQAEIDKAGAIC